MYAIITDGSISKYVVHPKPLVIGDVQYPARIFSAWTASELAAIGIIEVTFDNTNKKDEKWYINTNQSFDFDGNEVTASYGTATPKAHADVTETIDGVEYTTPGLKTNLIRDLKITVANELSKTDWYITRNTEKETAIPSAISTHRDSVRTKQAEMETAITNASDTPALETLYTYTEQDDGSVTRPLGELPTLEI